MLPCQFVYIYVQYKPDTFLVFAVQVSNACGKLPPNKFSSDGVSLEVPALKNP